MKTIILAISFFILTSHKAQAQTLTSEFSGKTAAGHFLKLKYAGPSTWKLSDYTPCTKFPCEDKDQTTETLLTSRWISSRTVADGNTVIGLSNGMTVTFVNNGLVAPKPDGTRVESYWRLAIPSSNGEIPEIVKLYFAPSVE